ncbi:hypothetical protein LOZ27_006056, partial [Ophidiomyces ophidiicola]
MSDAADAPEVVPGRKQQHWLLASNRRLRHLQGISIRNLLVTPPPGNARSRGKATDDEALPHTLQSPAKRLAGQEQRAVKHTRSATDLAGSSSTATDNDGGHNQQQQQQQHRTGRRRRSTLPWSGASAGVRQTRLEDVAAARMADTWFSLHTEAGETVYTSEVVARAMNPSFRPFDLRGCGPQVSRSDRVTVRVWARRASMAREDETLLLLEVRAHLSGLQYLGPRLASFHQRLPTNCVVFHLADGVYAGLANNMADAGSVAAPPRPGAAARSSSFDALLRLANLERCVQDARATRARVEAQITAVLAAQRAHDEVVNRTAAAHERLAAVRGYVAATRQRVQTATRRRDALRASVAARRAALLQARADEAAAREHLAAAHGTTARSKAQLQRTADDTQAQRRRLCRTLAAVFRLTPVAGEPLGFSIVGLRLPRAPYAHIADGARLAAALGYTAQLVQLLAQYLAVALPYPITACGSHSRVGDPISAGLAARTFPLAPGGGARGGFRFEYAVFLLNKDVEQLLDRAASSPPPQHRRGYQACDPCRKRKVKCDLGSVDNPRPPPCVRCRRESKRCEFSATRRKRKADEADADAEPDRPASGGGGGGVLRRDKRMMAAEATTVDDPPPAHPHPRTPFDAPWPDSPPPPPPPPPAPRRPYAAAPAPTSAPADAYHPTPPPPPPPQPAASLARAPSFSGRARPSLAGVLDGSPHMMNQTAAELLSPAISNTHDALHLLSEAAGRTEDLNRQQLDYDYDYASPRPAATPAARPS